MTQSSFDKILAHSVDPEIASFFEGVSFHLSLRADGRHHAQTNFSQRCSCNTRKLSDRTLPFSMLSQNVDSLAHCVGKSALLSNSYEYIGLPLDFLSAIDRLNLLVEQEIPTESFEDLLAMLHELLKLGLLAGPTAFEIISPFAASNSAVSIFSASLSEAVAERFNEEALNFLCAPPKVSDAEGENAFRFAAFNSPPRTIHESRRYFNELNTTAPPDEYFKVGIESLIKHYLLDALLLPRRATPNFEDLTRPQIMLLSDHEMKAADELGILCELICAPELKLNSVEFDLMLMLAKNQIELNVLHPEDGRYFDFAWVRPTLQSFEALKD